MKEEVGMVNVGKNTIAEACFDYDNKPNVRLIEEILTDGSKVYTTLKLEVLNILASARKTLKIVMEKYWKQHNYST